MPIKLPQESNPAPEDQKRNADDQFNRAMAKKRRLSTEPVEEEERPAPHRRLKYGTGQAQSPEQSAALRADRSEDDKRFAAALLRVMKLLPISMTPIDCPFEKDCPFSHKSVKAVAVHAALKHLDKIHAFLRKTIDATNGTNYLLRVCNVADARLYTTLEKVLRDPLRCEPCNLNFYSQTALNSHKDSRPHQIETTGTVNGKHFCHFTECSDRPGFQLKDHLRNHLFTALHFENVANMLLHDDLAGIKDLYERTGITEKSLRSGFAVTRKCPGCPEICVGVSSLVEHMAGKNHSKSATEGNRINAEGYPVRASARGGLGGLRVDRIIFDCCDPSSVKALCDTVDVSCRGRKQDVYARYVVEYKKKHRNNTEEIRNFEGQL